MSPVVLASLMAAAVALVLLIWWIKLGKAHALHDAAATGNLDRIEKLIASGFGIDAIYDHVSPLHVAVMRNRAEAAKRLLSLGASVDLKTESDDHVTALHLAAKLGNRDMVDLLLRHGADIHVQASNSESPLLTAARSGHTDVFTALLSKGASLECTDANGNTMLFTCIMNDDPGALGMLLDAGMDPNAQDPDEQAYALHAAMIYAIHSGKTDLVECLLKHGADPKVRDQHGMTPMKMATISNKENLIDLLKTYGA